MKGSRILATGLLVFAVVALLAFAGVAGAAKPHPANTVFTHGYVYTVNPGQRTAQAVAVRDGKIIYVGSNQGARAFVGKKTEVVDLKGKMLMPSFSDGHAHPQAAVSFLYAANLYGLDGTAGVQGRRSRSSSPPTRPWTPTRGAAGARRRTRASARWSRISSALTSKPMALWSDGHHSLWVNQAALDLAGIDNTTPDPIGGVIERVPGSVVDRPAVRHSVRHAA